MLDFDVIEAKKETPKKEASKGKAVKAKKSKKEPVAEPEPVVDEVVEAPKAKTTKAKKGKKQQEEPVNEVVEVDAIVTENGDVEDAADDDDQTAALLAGFSSDDSDSENDIDFPEEEGAVPKLTKSQKKAIAKAKDTPKASEPGVIYIGYAAMPVYSKLLFANCSQPRPTRFLRTPNEEVLFTVWPRPQSAPLAQQENWSLQALCFRRVCIRRGCRHCCPYNEQLPHVRTHLEVLAHP